MRIRGYTEGNFWSKVERNGPIPSHMPHLGPCWIWQGDVNMNGYGVFKYGYMNGVPLLKTAHRFAWLLVRGDIPYSPGWVGTVVMHKCDNKRCVNLTHLELGTHSSNMQDKVSKGRCNALRGIENPRAKLTTETVRLIRELYNDFNVIQRDLCIIFNLSKHQVNLIVNNKTWKHV